MGARGGERQRPHDDLAARVDPLQFVFSGNRPPKLNRLWIEQMLLSANSTAGLQFVPEPAENDPIDSE